MATRVHPHASSPPHSGKPELKTTSSPSEPTSEPTPPETTSSPSEPTSEPTPPAPAKPTPGTYIVKVPKDLVYRVPPPENSRRYDRYTRRKNRRSWCRCCFCWFVGLVFLFIVLFGIVAGVLYLVFRPEAPDFAVDRISVRGMDLASASVMSPEFDVAVRVNNPNDKIGIFYERDGSVEIYYNEDVRLSNGTLPAFYQPSNNVTVIQTALKGSSVVLSSADREALVDQQTEGKVPLKMKLTAFVKIEVGSVKTWGITIKINCGVTLDKLTEQAKIVSKDCGYGLELCYNPVTPVLYEIFSYLYHLYFLVFSLIILGIETLLDHLEAENENSSDYRENLNSAVGKYSWRPEWLA
ncbi:NDR1/HIN1-like protein 13 [Senna tora]|uniref:NDR1/HIN1-like protein 13 n=1 Tax=Senna tora TaxID=362788 RepID=A0A834U0D7_9FABA|nr:NDR1/HIN1-like protein 13 [Senna tora]